MTYPCFAVQVVIRKCIDATVGPLTRDPLHVAPIKPVITSEDDGALQGVAFIWHLAPHVEADLFPGVNGQPNPLQLHALDPPLHRRFVQRPMPC